MVSYVYVGICYDLRQNKNKDATLLTSYGSSLVYMYFSVHVKRLYIYLEINITEWCDEMYAQSCFNIHCDCESNNRIHNFAALFQIKPIHF